MTGLLTVNRREGGRPRAKLVIFGCALAWLSCIPDLAAAATVELAQRTAVSYGTGWAGIDYRAAPGEANRVVLDQVDQLTIRVADAGAAITPGRGCASLDLHTAQCSVAGLRGSIGLIGANVRAGDLDDVVDSRGPGLSGNGGSGDDTLQSSSGAAGILDGGGGHDTLLGGTNQDTLVDGDASGAADDDVLDGREGGAIVSYASRTAPVHVDLADPGPDGEFGERDVLRAVNGATGGRAGDVLRGDAGVNTLDGGPGDDRLIGRGGDDFLSGGDGADRIAAQAGDDFADGGGGADVVSGDEGADLLLGGRGSDRLRGGDGSDVLRSGSAWCGRGVDTATPARRDYVDPQCELAEFALPMGREVADAKGVAAKPYPSVRRDGSMIFRVQCPYLETDGYPDALELRGTLHLITVDGRLLGAAPIPDAGRRCGNQSEAEDRSELLWVRIHVVLHRSGRDLLRRARARRVLVAFSGRNVPPAPWSIRLPGR